LTEHLKTGPIRVRPRYRRLTSANHQLIIDHILKALAAKKGISGSTLENHAYLHIPMEEQHYWSPEFDITIEEMEEGALVRGVVGPKAKVWTMFMFFYSAVFVLLFLGVSMGVSQWMLGMNAPILWSVPACLILWLLILIAAKFGQFKGKSQTERMWRFLESAVDQAEQDATPKSPSHQ